MKKNLDWIGSKILICQIKKPNPLNKEVGNFSTQKPRMATRAI